ncbi:glucuronate isomerase [Deltaproteobacteria bacterium Smac51]|nr:glucuronate isomerase [Deltaproteobacteria bacterium Smac51]
MSGTFLDDNFLLPCAAAERLYHEYAAGQPIYDYHSHLPIKQILDDVTFQNMTQVWLYGDHYKWRAMRASGVPETHVSGIPEAADDYARFEAWAKVLPRTISNPLYHWSHLELKRYFGVDKQLSPATCREIYDHCAAKLTTPEFSVRSIIRRSNVALVCTTDDPVDDLADHLKLANDNFQTAVLPAWRPDKALAADNAETITAWLDKLEKAANRTVATFRDLLEALWGRHQFFHDSGCRLSDYGIERPYAVPYTDSEVEAAFKKIRSGQALSGDELEKYRSAILYELLKMDAEQDWTQQLHFGAKRNNSSRALALRGPDTGYDSIGEFPIGDALVALLDRLEREDKLTRTIIYVLNPKDNDMIASLIGSFQDGKTVGKMQFGTAWWHNDHKDGMIRQMNALASMGLISRFVGMLTDSRSFLSYPRHEYFRRLLCAKLGCEMDAGEIPMDFELVGGMVADICYGNAHSYFNMI